LQSGIAPLQLLLKLLADALTVRGATVRAMSWFGKHTLPEVACICGTECRLLQQRRTAFIGDGVRRWFNSAA